MTAFSEGGSTDPARSPFREVGCVPDGGFAAAVPLGRGPACDNTAQRHRAD